MKDIKEYRFTMFRDGEVEYKEMYYNVIAENEKTLVYEDNLGCFRVVHLNNQSVLFNIQTSLDEPIVAEGFYYSSDMSSFERKQGVVVYLHTFKPKEGALEVIKNAIIEKYSWIDRISVENAINKIKP